MLNYCQVEIAHVSLDDSEIGDVYLNDESIYFPALKADELYTNEIEMPRLILEEGSNYVDFLDSSNILWSGILVSEKVKKILESFTLPDYKIFKIKVCEEDNEGCFVNYYFFNFKSVELELVKDIEVNIFESGSIVEYNKKIQYNDLVEMRKDLKRTRKPVVVRFNNDEIKEKGLDLIFNRHLFYGDVHISNKLKDKLESEGIKGAKYMKSKNLVM